MSRPIKEKGPRDIIGEQTHATRQLQRRPAPAVPAAVLEYAYLARGTNLTMTTGTVYLIGGAAAGNWDSAVDGTTMDADIDTGEIRPSEAGLYHCFAYWDASTTFSQDGILRIDVGISSANILLGNFGTSAWARQAMNDGYCFGHGVALVASTPNYAGGDTGFTLSISQQSGSNKDMNNARLMVVRYA